jgi:4-amino-4-deoxy-L-arabinose transferase-like glycosyltransferase
LSVAAGEPAACGAAPSRREASRWAWPLAALAVALVAIAFRCWRLAGVPPGLYIDEVLTARNALAWRLDANAFRLDSWLGSRPLLMPGWVETSNLYLAFASAVLALGGDGLAGVRLVSVLPSLAAVPLVYLLAREVGDRRTGLLAAFLLAASHWAARSGRTGWDAVLMVSLQLAALACLAGALRRERVAPAIAAGALFGLALHTYVAARLALAQGLGWLGWEAVAERRRRDLVRLVLVAAGALVVGLPLVVAVARGAPLVTARETQLSVFARHGAGEPWVSLGRNVAGHLAMFHVRGGAYARDALPGFPMLDPVTGALLVAGLVAAVRERGWRRRLLLSWPLAMAMGGILSTSGEGPPYPYRVLSLAPWACLVAALGGVSLWDGLSARLARGKVRCLAAAALLAVVAVNGWVLFVAGPADPATQRVYGTAATRVGRWLAVHRAGRPVVVLAGALREPPLPVGYRYADANRTSFFRDVDTAAAVQLAAGLYRTRPERARDPLRPEGDIDLLASLPARLARPTLLVVAPGGEPAVAGRFAIEERIVLRFADGTPLAVVLVSRP